MMDGGRARNPESGFAMLVVFLLAAFIAIALYNELPRVVMESQRDKEQTLIDRGEQYKRAIQLYFRAFGRYPPDLDALENTNNRRFLRRRYKDPMTGEDEWRLIHATGLGVFPDSLVYGPQGGESSQGGAAQAAAQTEAPVPLWQQQRPSDMILTPAEGLPPAPAAEDETAALPPQPVAPGTQVDVTMPAPGQAATVGISAGMVPGGTPAEDSGALPIPSPVGPPGVAAGGAQPFTPGGQAAAAGGQTPGTPASNPALQLIQRLLTTPTQRGNVTAAAAAAAQQPVQVGGIAGIASKRDAESIKVYNDRTNYKEWEFLYDVRQDRMAMAAMMRQAPAIGAPGGTPDTSVPLMAPGRGGAGGRGGPMGPGGRGGQMGPGGMGPGRGFGGGGGFGPGGFGGIGGPVQGPAVPQTPQPVPGRGR